MYEVQHRRYYNRSNDFALIASDCKTLGEAQQARAASGDLVVESVTGLVVTDKSWLWDWEKGNPNSYAHVSGSRKAPLSAFLLWFGIHIAHCKRHTMSKFNGSAPSAGYGILYVKSKDCATHHLTAEKRLVQR